MFTQKDRENRDWFCDTRAKIIELLEEEGAENWAEAAKLLTSALNEVLAPSGEQAIVILRPLVVYREADDKI